jgi:hypothetical protein
MDLTDELCYYLGLRIEMEEDVFAEMDLGGIDV